MKEYTSIIQKIYAYAGICGAITGGSSRNRFTFETYYERMVTLFKDSMFVEGESIAPICLPSYLQVDLLQTFDMIGLNPVTLVSDTMLTEINDYISKLQERPNPTILRQENSIWVYLDETDDALTAYFPNIDVFTRVLSSGHYLAAIKDDDQKWYYCNGETPVKLDKRNHTFDYTRNFNKYMRGWITIVAAALGNRMESGYNLGLDPDEYLVVMPQSISAYGYVLHDTDTSNIENESYVTEQLLNILDNKTQSFSLYSMSKPLYDKFAGIIAQVPMYKSIAGIMSCDGKPWCYDVVTPNGIYIMYMPEFENLYMVKGNDAILYTYNDKCSRVLRVKGDGLSLLDELEQLAPNSDSENVEDKREELCNILTEYCNNLHLESREDVCAAIAQALHRELPKDVYEQLCEGILVDFL